MDTTSLNFQYTRQTNGQALIKREANIHSFSSLNRNGLIYRQRERRLLLYTTQSNEMIYIQYPGKETVSDTPNLRRPWDFRPKLFLANGLQVPDLSFKDIWDDLERMHSTNAEAISALAAIFLRMAYMIDYTNETNEYNFYDFTIDATENPNIISQGVQLLSWWKPQFDLNLLAEIQRNTGLIRGASLEAYLVYNDLLVQNEDCKYYYRDVLVNQEQWNDKVGRHNTLLTHLSVIEFLLGQTSFSQIMDKFQRGRGVAPAGVRSFSAITNGIIQQ